MYIICIRHIYTHINTCMFSCTVVNGRYITYIYIYMCVHHLVLYIHAYIYILRERERHFLSGGIILMPDFIVVGPCGIASWIFFRSGPVASARRDQVMQHLLLVLQGAPAPWVPPPPPWDPEDELGRGHRNTGQSLNILYKRSYDFLDAYLASLIYVCICI